MCMLSAQFSVQESTYKDLWKLSSDLSIEPGALIRVFVAMVSREQSIPENIEYILESVRKQNDADCNEKVSIMVDIDEEIYSKFLDFCNNKCIDSKYLVELYILEVLKHNGVPFPLEIDPFYFNGKY